MNESSLNISFLERLAAAFSLSRALAAATSILRLAVGVRGVPRRGRETRDQTALTTNISRACV